MKYILNYFMFKFIINKLVSIILIDFIPLKEIKIINSIKCLSQFILI